MDHQENQISLDMDPLEPTTTTTTNNNTYANTSSSSSPTRTTTTTTSSSLNTLEEPVWTTIWRDLSSILRKCKVVLIPQSDQSSINELRDWDLWGPLLFCLILAVCMGVNAKTGQSGIVFAGVFMIVWLGSAVVTVNAQLLGGKISFFQSVCLLGYCILPLVVCSVVFVFLHMWLGRIFLVVAAFVWSVVSSVAFVSASVDQDRRMLSMYPLILFYLFIAYLVFVM